MEARRAALLVHDMQRYFLAPYESDVFVERMVSRIRDIRRWCHSVGAPTFYTAQRGGQAKEDRGLLVDFWGAGMPEGAPQAIVPGLEPVEALMLYVLRGLGIPDARARGLVVSRTRENGGETAAQA